MNIKNMFLKLVQKLGSRILYGRPVLVSKHWVLCWQALALAEVVGLGAEGRNLVRLFQMLLFHSLTCYPMEYILLRKSGWSYAFQSFCCTRMRRKRDGCGSKHAASKWAGGHAGNTWPLFLTRIQKNLDFLRWDFWARWAR